MSWFKPKNAGEPTEPPIAAPVKTESEVETHEAATELEVETQEVEAHIENSMETLAPDTDDADLLSLGFEPDAKEETNAETPAEVTNEAASETRFEPAPEASPVLKPLAAGAFLNGELEIKEVVARGPINVYLADAGDWSASDARLVFERANGEFVEADVEAELFPPAERFAANGREYAVFPFEPLSSWDDWSPPSNDEIYVSTLKTLAEGLKSLEDAGLTPNLPTESLYISPARQIRFLGFFERGGQNENGVGSLAALSSRFSKRNLAHGATLRLDDEFGALPLSDEVKTFARALTSGEIPSLSDALERLQTFAPLAYTESALVGDVGIEREINEDSGFIWKFARVGHELKLDLELLVVADGMGGHEGGEVASRRTLDALQIAFLKRLDLRWDDNSAVRAALGEIITEVNEAVVRMNENPPYAAQRHKPGATLTFALRLGSRVFLGNVGDSRAYRWNAKNGLERLTKDHSYVQDLLDQNRITEDEVWNHPDGSIITSHIGMPKGLLQDVYLRMLRPGDRLIVVSDGVVDTLRDESIEAIVSEADTAQSLAQTLTDAANDAGGIDNITVAVLFCS